MVKHGAIGRFRAFVKTLCDLILVVLASAVHLLTILAIFLFCLKVAPDSRILIHPEAYHWTFVVIMGCLALDLILELIYVFLWFFVGAPLWLQREILAWKRTSRPRTCMTVLLTQIAGISILLNVGLALSMIYESMALRFELTKRLHLDVDESYVQYGKFWPFISILNVLSAAAKLVFALHMVEFLWMRTLSQIQKFKANIVSYDVKRGAIVEKLKKKERSKPLHDAVSIEEKIVDKAFSFILSEPNGYQDTEIGSTLTPDHGHPNNDFSDAQAYGGNSSPSSKIFMNGLDGHVLPIPQQPTTDGPNSEKDIYHMEPNVTRTCNKSEVGKSKSKKAQREKPSLTLACSSSHSSLSLPPPPPPPPPPMPPLPPVVLARRSPPPVRARAPQPPSLQAQTFEKESLLDGAVQTTATSKKA